MILLKLILSLMVGKASLKDYYLNIGAHLLKKGCGFQVGQIIKEKRLQNNLYRVSVVTGLFYDFNLNKVVHTCDKKIIKPNEKNG